jgi:hypothetical protein
VDVTTPFMNIAPALNMIQYYIKGITIPQTVALLIMEYEGTL